jgi:hypothetical protein
MKKKLVYGAIAIISLCLFTIILWEQVRDGFFTVFDNSVEMTREEAQVEFTLDALISAKAESWLTGPEALEYAKNQVRGEVIDELSKK